jgi:predicted NodU family carbamoyl transferase
MPLCGDQGAALGMIDVDIDNLFLGKRNITDLVIPVTNNIWFNFRGDMEFGPRALGNTSCIALPTKENTEIINKMNGRPNIMPMAPMISFELAEKYCKNIKALGRCKEYMIVATDWLGPIDGQYTGVLHRKPCSDVYTCRPQVVNNYYTEKYGVVINTSLNAHGQPILFDNHDYKEMRIIHEEHR